MSVGPTGSQFLHAQLSTKNTHSSLCQTGIIIISFVYTWDKMSFLKDRAERQHNTRIETYLQLTQSKELWVYGTEKLCSTIKYICRTHYNLIRKKWGWWSRGQNLMLPHPNGIPRERNWPCSLSGWDRVTLFAVNQCECRGGCWATWLYQRTSCSPDALILSARL